MKIFLSIITAIFLFVSSFSSIYAIVDPLQAANNKFGMHIVDTNDLDDVAKLVNSEGGDWGYVTLVIQQGERNKTIWQEVFNKMRRLHLIPIVRVATRPIADKWEKPTLGDIDGWVSFLSSLNWVVKNRYVVIGNEPNHAKEWGGEINPEEFATYTKEFAQKLKSSSDDFFIMAAGLDASATTSKKFGTMDEKHFLDRVFKKEPDLFNYLDGLASHSYPNPAFSGSVQAVGKGTIRSFEWELDYLKSKGVNKQLPVFITETGWIHRGDTNQKKLLTAEEVGQYYEVAYKDVWNVSNVVAVTPFIFNYIQEPFNDFSWKKENGEFYSFYENVKNLKKVKGDPVQIEKGTILTGFIPPSIGKNYFYLSLITVNTGQSIWTKEETSIVGNTSSFKIGTMYPDQIEPGGIGLISAGGKIETDHPLGTNYLELARKGKAISNKFFFTPIRLSQELEIDPIYVFSKSVAETINNLFNR